MEASFSRLQMMFLLLLALGISNHVLVIPHLLQAAGRDAWISVLFAYAALICWSLLLFLVLRSMRTVSFADWLRERLGNIGCWIVSGGLIVYLLLAGTIIIFDTTKTINIYFLPQTPDTIIILSFVLLAFGAARSGLKTVIYLSTLLLPFVWVLGIGVSWMTMDSKDYGMLFPVFTEGIDPSIRGGAVVFGGTVDLLILLLLQHKLSKPLNYGTIFILLTLLVGLIIGPAVGSTAAFGPYQGGNLRFPAFEQWRLVTIGRQISHVDFLAVFQLMAGSVVRTALMMHLLFELVGGQGTKSRFIVKLALTLLMTLPALAQVSDIRVQKIIHDYFYTSSLWFGVGMTAVLLVAASMPRRKGGKSNESIA